MNERIEEIAEQAELWKPNSLPSNWDVGDYVVSPEQMEKFAELIVKECADIAKNYAGGSMPVSISLAIKSKFGVK